MKKKDPLDFSMYDIAYMDKIIKKHDMRPEVARFIVLYSKGINDGLTVYWFLDRLTEYIARFNPYDLQVAKNLIEGFHHKYVVPFGR